MKEITNLLKGMTSRKFLLALGTVLVLIANEQYNEAVVVVLGYLGVNVADQKLNSGK